MFLQVSAYLSVTVYVEDVNDHSPQFEGAPYSVMLDELTPVGKWSLRWHLLIIYYIKDSPVCTYYVSSKLDRTILFPIDTFIPFSQLFNFGEC